MGCWTPTAGCSDGAPRKRFMGRVRTGGLLLRTRVPGNRFADYRITVHVQQARTVLDPFPRDGYRGVFESGQVRIESHDGAVISSRAHPRAAFFEKKKKKLSRHAWTRRKH